MAGKIEAPGSWHFHIVGAIPPGIDPALMEANILTSVSIVMNLSPWVRGFWVEMSDQSPEQLKERETARKKLQLEQ